MKLPYKTILLLVAAIAIALLADAWRSARRDSQQLAATIAAQNLVLQRSGQDEKKRDAQLASALAAIQAQKRAVRTPEQAAQKLPEAFPPLPLPITIHIPALSELCSPSDSSDSSKAIPATSEAEEPPSSGTNHPSFANVSSSPAGQSSPKPSNSALITLAPKNQSLGPRKAQPRSGGQFAETPVGQLAETSASHFAETSITIPRPDLIPLYNALQDCRADQARAAALQQDLSNEKARTAALQQERNAALTAAHGGPILQHLKRAVKWFAIGAVTGATIAAATHH